MAGTVSFRIPIAHKGFARFDVAIRPRELTEHGAGQLKPESAFGSGCGKSAWSGQSHLWEQMVKSVKILRTGE